MRFIKPYKYYILEVIVMKRKMLAVLLALMMVMGMAALPAAAATPPTAISAPENFAAANYGGYGVHCTMSLSDDLRALAAKTQEERGYSLFIKSQVDFKTDGGSWHYTSDWDDPATYQKYALGMTFGGVSKELLDQAERLTFKTMFPDETNVPVPAAFTSWDWYKSHSMTLRARFAVTFGSSTVLFSDWSEEYVLSNSSKMDYKKILSENAPTIISSKIETKGVNNVPWVALEIARHSDRMELFNAAANNSVWTEIWLRKAGDQDFKNVGAVNFSKEIINLDVSAYFKEKLTSYDAVGYEVKLRYKVDERAYQQSGATALNWLYSPYSNIYSYGMPAWSAASAWATPELKKADDYGLIPAALNGADLTKPITREEFAALAVVLYEKTTGKTAVAASSNPFTDTQNPETLKAFALGITTGTSATTFEPKALTNRQQVATMLSRAIRVMVPDGDFSTAGAPTFSDQKDIDSWALDHVKFMSKIGIIKGTNGKFMPKATTTAQQASGYATTTREQAIAMGVRIYEQYK